MEFDKIKEYNDEALALLSGVVKPTDIKRWVLASERQPTSEGYYIVLRGNSNPNFVHTCKPAVHFWYEDEKRWSSETKYWMEDVSTTIHLV